jgi:hypothetical protein
MIDRLDDLTLADANQFCEHIKDWKQLIEYLCGTTPSDSLELQYVAILKPFFIRAVAARAAKELAASQSNSFEVCDDDIPF